MGGYGEGGKCRRGVAGSGEWPGVSGTENTQRKTRNTYKAAGEKGNERRGKKMEARKGNEGREIVWKGGCIFQGIEREGEREEGREG